MDIINIENKCRACLTDNEPMFSLFEIYEHDLTLAMILQSCIATEVKEDDGLPSHLCDSCILVLTKFYNFTIVYEKSDNQLRKLLKKNIKLVSIGEVDEHQTSTNEDVEELGVYDACDNNILNEIVAVEVNQADVISNFSCSDNLELFEYKNVNCDLESNDNTVEVPDCEVRYDDSIQEFKKEVILPKEELENVNQIEYSDIQMPEHKDVFIKKEDSQAKDGAEYQDIIKYECSVCGESHLYASGFQQHMRIKHKMTDIDCNDYAIKVQVKVYHKVNNVDKNHFASQENIGNLDDERGKCKYCQKEFFLSELQHHVKVHEANRKYVCEVCGARFIRKTYLDDHMEGHSNEKKHVCKFCGKAYRRRTVLRAHKRVHTHPNHYVCEQCGRAFTNGSTLKTHKLLIHLKERNFLCVICNRTFPLKSTLNKHVLRHQKRENGEKGFNCPECDMQYRDKSSLKRHMDLKHQGPDVQIQLIACQDCPKKYTSKANLIKHRRRHHNITNLLEISS